MEIVADITDCIVDLQTIGHAEELELASCLQEWVQDFINPDKDSPPEAYEELEEGELIEEGEIKEDKSDIAGRSIEIKSSNSKKERNGSEGNGK